MSNDSQSRGKWLRPADFIFACVGHAFKADTILFMPVIAFQFLGFYAIIPYLLIAAVCVVPIVFIQSYLGQFSGTGFISAFRIAPLFKGIGYAALTLNVITLAYFSIFCAIPLISISYVLRPTIPWSCEGTKEWIGPLNGRISPCELNVTSIKGPFTFLVPSVEFFETNISLTKQIPDPGFSWSLFLCISLIWIAVVFIVMRSIKTIGRFASYSCAAVIVTMCILMARFVLLPGAPNGIMQFFKPTRMSYPEGWIALIYTALSTFGPGWGSIVTMASFNDFKTNIYKFTWIVSFVQLAIFLGTAFLAMLMSGFLFTPFGKEAVVHANNDIMSLFLVIPTGLTLMEVPRFWSLIFFGMLFVGSLNLLVMQLFSVLTALFDEYESLRSNKRRVTLSFGAILVVGSSYFCTNHGLGLLMLLSKSAVITQMLLNLLLLLVVLWTYGRERFQRDVIFMTGRVYSTLIVNLTRFVSPVFLIIGIIIGLLLTADHIFRHFSFEVVLTLIALTVIPWCLVPFSGVYRVMQTTGGIYLRFKKCLQPNDWYPADFQHKQRYVETFNNPETSYRLTMGTDD